MYRLICCLALVACSAGKGSLDSTGPTTGTVGGAPTGSPTTTGTPGTGTPTGTQTSLALDTRTRGPFTTVSTTDTIPVVTCDMAITTYEPDGSPPLATAILAHGFARNRSHMAALADHWASWGLRVVTPNLCHATPFDTNHPENAEDLAALAEAVAPGEPIVYAGHSAGALGTWLAAAADPDAMVHLGLDPVDTQGLGDAVDGDHTVPTFALFGEPETCNSQGNAVGWYGSGSDDRALRITGADHCDFEGPTDALCTAFCATGSGNDAVVSDIVVAMSTAFVLWQTGIEPDAAGWWTPGDARHDLVLTGATEL